MSKRKSNLSLADVLDELDFDSEGNGKTDGNKTVEDILDENKPFSLQKFLFTEENDNVVIPANKQHERDILDCVADRNKWNDPKFRV